MGDRQARTQHRPMTPIEKKKSAAGVVIQDKGQVLPDPLSSPEAAKTFAFKMQEGDFIEGIERPQFWVEFQAVDDCHGLAQPDVLGAKIAMGINEPPSVNSLKQQGGAFCGKAALDLDDSLHRASRKAEAGIEQHAAIVGEGLLP